MAHIQVPEALHELVEVLLRGPNTLTPAERGMIATYVSSMIAVSVSLHTERQQPNIWVEITT